MGVNEKHLLYRAKNGDIEAFEILVENYEKKAFNIAYRMMGNYDDASDLTQEALLRIYRSLQGFREHSSLSTWIYRITTNVCLDELRRRKNKWTVSIDEEIKFDDSEVKRQLESDGPTPEEEFEKKELKEIVSEAIDLLPEEQKTAIVLRDIQGFSYEEISKIMECPEGTVKSRINRARNMLRDILKSKKELLNLGYVK